MTDSQPALASAESTPRFSHPRVMLIDLGEDDAELLTGAGYRVTEGTLGTPYRVKARDGYAQVWRSSALAGLTEQDVVVIDFVPRFVSDQPRGVQPTETAHQTTYAECSGGLVDPRPLAARDEARYDIERIVEHGGVVIAFAGPKLYPNLIVGSKPVNSAFKIQGNLNITVWDAVRYLDFFRADALSGDEIKTATDYPQFASLRKHLEEATYECRISPANDGTWLTLAENKFGDAVAGVEFGSPEMGSGLVFLLPRVADRGATVKLLLDEILPEMRPMLFPESDRLAWKSQAPYELPDVRRLKDEIEAVRAAAVEREDELQHQISQVLSDQDWVLDLVSATDRKLVDAVQLALEELGFEGVCNSDDKIEGGAGKDDKRLREDLQIAGQPLVLVEVKGINSLPKEEDTLAVAKYLAPRMRQLDRKDVRGLAVINHQRGLPPLDRENVNTFQDDVLTNARHLDFTVITGFDLYRLVIGKRQLGWRHEDISPLFYAPGRIVPVPKHYEPVGTIEKRYEQASVVGIRVSGRVSVGDTLAYEGEISFVEEQVMSLQIDDTEVDSAQAGDGVGLKTALTKEQARVGARVFRIASHNGMSTAE